MRNYISGTAAAQILGSECPFWVGSGIASRLKRRAASFTMQHNRKVIVTSEVFIGTRVYEIGTVFLVCRDRARSWLYGYKFISTGVMSGRLWKIAVWFVTPVTMRPAS
jgi:hypothetical protein